jgi:hypothetical protein
VKDKTETTGDNPAPAIEVILVPTEPAVSLVEFCTRLSQKDRRVETIGAFHADETKQQRTRDTYSAFLKRYEAFRKRPA